MVIISHIDWSYGMTPNLFRKDMVVINNRLFILLPRVENLARFSLPAWNPARCLQFFRLAGMEFKFQGGFAGRLKKKHNVGNTNILEFKNLELVVSFQILVIRNCAFHRSIRLIEGFRSVPVSGHWRHYGVQCYCF